MSDNRTLYKFASTDKASMRPSVNNMNREMLINEVLDSRKKLQQSTYAIKQPEKPIQRQKINWLGFVAVFILGYCAAMMVTTINNVKYQEQHHCTPINIDRG
jgi:hypothetical protein